jgi:hypothetical protein
MEMFSLTWISWPFHLNFFLISGVELWVLRPLTGLLYQPRMIGDDDCGEIGEMKIGRENRSTRRKPAPASLLSITKFHTNFDPGLNPGRRGAKPATMRLSYGADLSFLLTFTVSSNLCRLFMDVTYIQYSAYFFTFFLQKIRGNMNRRIWRCVPDYTTALCNTVEASPLLATVSWLRKGTTKPESIVLRRFSDKDIELGS